MEIKVGDYVRTTTGEIAKIEYKNQEYYETDRMVYKFNEFNLYAENITKHSHNIIDLIEVGDYVNGYKVIDIVKGFKVIIDKLELDTTTGTYQNIGIKDIKTIVTREQFAGMEYKV